MMIYDPSIFERHIRRLSPIETGMIPRLAGLVRYGAILFDVYGTLLVSAAGEIDSQAASPGVPEGLSEVFRRYGIKLPAEDLMQRLPEAVRNEHGRLKQEGIDYPEVDIVQIWQRLLAFTSPEQAGAFALEVELTVNPVYPMPGAAALLSSCQAQQLPMGIISNAQAHARSLLEWILGTSLARSGFEEGLVFFSYRWGHAKPSPVMFDQAATVLAAMGIPARSVLYVGNDIRNDILPAQRTGFATALFAGDRRSLRLRENDDRYRHVVPDAVVTDLRQLIPGSRAS